MPAPPSRTTAAARSLLRRWTIIVISLLVAVTGLGAVAGPASAATVYEIKGEWVSPPASISR
ncbi:hypothetical protein, partial [Nocardioides sp.]